MSGHGQRVVFCTFDVTLRGWRGVIVWSSGLILSFMHYQFHGGGLPNEEFYVAISPEDVAHRRMNSLSQVPPRAPLIKGRGTCCEGFG